jgi:hypothetical protein
MINTTRCLLGSVAAIVVLVTGCTSATSGSGIGAPAPSTVPSSFAGTGSSVGPGANGGGGSSAAAGTAAFCAEYESATPNIDFGNVDGGALHQLLAHYDKLYELAPPAVKPDVKVFDDYVHALANHSPPDSADLAPALAHLLSWTVQNCP